MKRKYLLKPDTPDLRDRVFSSCCFQHVAHLPPMVDLRPGCSPVVDQGELGSCTANAIASGLREYWLNQTTTPWPRLSRLFLYYEERKLEGTINEDSGAMIRDGMKVMASMGTCPEAEYLYDITQFRSSPTAQEIHDAQKYKISAYHRITSLTTLKAALAEGLPVVIGINIYESFEGDGPAKTGIIPMPDTAKEQLLGGHAVCAVGYDGAKQWVIVRNSWGTGWGDKGYFYLPYAYIAPKYTSDMWTGK